MKTNISKMDKLTDQILKADISRKKKIINIKIAHSYGTFFLFSPFLLYIAAKICLPNYSPLRNLNPFNSSVPVISTYSMDHKPAREILSPEIYYKEKALLDKNYSIAVTEFLNEKLGEDNKYKPVVWQ